MSQAVQTPDEAQVEYTVDELAARTGTTVRNIRHYVELGLIPPPQRRGRPAYYNQVHRLRLELIKQLYDHGYALATITRVLDRLPLDATPVEVSMRAALLMPWSAADVDPVEREVLNLRAGGRLDDEALRIAVAMGAARRLPDDRLQVAPHMMAHAERAAACGVPPAFFDRIAGIIDEHVTALVDELFALRDEEFPAGVWPDFVNQMDAAMPDIRPLVFGAVINRFTSRVKEAIETWSTNKAPRSDHG